MQSLKDVAKKIIQANIYLSLGTAEKTPWIAPVFYSVDDHYNFYFISQPNSLHSRQLTNNPHVAFAIFDSHQPEGQGIGIQGKGKAFLLGEEEIPEALKWYHTSFIDSKIESFTGSSPYRFYKLIPEKFYILDPEPNTDRRVEVKLP